MAKSLKFRDRICWVSAVGDDPAIGGGVARAVSLISQAGLIKANNGDLISLHGLSKIQQVALCIKMILVGYRKFVVHSFFSPFSLFLLCLPLPLRVVVLPHGELKCGALGINAKRKRLFLHFVRLFYRTNRHLKQVGGVATTDEELEVLRRTMYMACVYKAPDFLSADTLLAEPNSIDLTQGVNLVNIARMVPNKGMGCFLEALAAKLVSPTPSWTRFICGVYLFYLEEDAGELAVVTRLSEQVRSLGVSVYLFEGLPPDHIRQALCDVPNRLGFISSRFESFSYALVESLGFEYQPIVWFQNDLVDQLLSENLCQRLDYGSFEVAENCSPLQATAKEQVEAFIARVAAHNSTAYQRILTQTFGEVCVPVSSS
jgi:hypothetical protein